MTITSYFQPFIDLTRPLYTLAWERPTYQDAKRVCEEWLQTASRTASAIGVWFVAKKLGNFAKKKGIEWAGGWIAHHMQAGKYTGRMGRCNDWIVRSGAHVAGGMLSGIVRGVIVSGVARRLDPKMSTLTTYLGNCFGFASLFRRNSLQDPYEVHPFVKGALYFSGFKFSAEDYAKYRYSVRATGILTRRIEILASSCAPRLAHLFGYKLQGIS